MGVALALAPVASMPAIIKIPTHPVSRPQSGGDRPAGTAGLAAGHPARETEPKRLVG